MSINSQQLPDYELPDTVELTTPAQLRAIADPLRSSLLDLVLERAATVSELAAAVGRPKSTVAHHVAVLVDAGMLRVVRTRGSGPSTSATTDAPAAPSPSASRADPATRPPPYASTRCPSPPPSRCPPTRTTRSTARCATSRIPRESASEFWRRVEGLVREFTALPRSGDTVYGLAVGLYPTDQPVLPDREDA